MERKEQKSMTIEVKVPTVGESITEVTVGNWMKQDGDYVKLDEVICELESEKATFELNSPGEGILKCVGKVGDALPIGSIICILEPCSVSSDPAPNKPYSDSSENISPLASAILKDKGIAASSVKGTGPGGKITKEDVIRATSIVDAPDVDTKDKYVDPVKTAPVTPSTQTTSVVIPGREQRRTKMTSLRKTVARRLVAVKNEMAMLTTFNEVDMKPIMDLRVKYKDKFKEKHGVGLGFMSFFTKAVVTALQEFPAVNAMIDGDDIVYNDFVDVSIAVSAPKGLVVPVIRNVENMSFAQIEKEVVRLATMARDNKLTMDQMQGGTFTITNGGVFGSMLSTPIINAPQSAILGMHNIVERPVVVNGEIVVRPIMYVALSYDHRIIDGRESVGFLVKVKQLLEDPARLLLDI